MKKVGRNRQTLAGRLFAAKECDTVCTDCFFGDFTHWDRSLV